MEYFYGHSFDLFGFGVQLTIPQIVFLIVQIAEALDSVHARGWYHLAIKPENLMIVSKQAKILDFGFAAAFPHLLSDDAPEPMRITLSDARYLSPEQVMGEKPDQRADVFSLGAILYEILGGGPAFPGESRLAILLKVLHESPPPLRERARGLPRDVETVVGKLRKVGAEVIVLDRQSGSKLMVKHEGEKS